jgi:hypothetical protein
VFKTTSILCVLVCLCAASAAAETPALPEGTVTLADASGLHVRLAAGAVGGIQNSNLCGAAVNTEGVARATVAVMTDGRVYLTRGGTFVAPGSDVSVIAAADVTPTPTPAPTEQTSQAPQGMGAFLASLFGLARA